MTTEEGQLGQQQETDTGIGTQPLQFGWCEGCRSSSGGSACPQPGPRALSRVGSGKTVGRRLLGILRIKGVKVQEEVQPLPSFLRSEHTEPGAAARRRLRPARGRAHPTAAAARPLQLSPPPPPARLRNPAGATAPVRALPPPPSSPFVSSAPAPPPRLALCRGRSARPQRAREKPRRAPARLRVRPLLLLLPACAPLLAARRRRLAGGRGGGRRVCRRGAPLCSVTPGGRPRKGGGRAERN
ncbi:translation initiation factor IF-2-like [Sturnira hondurensis]|uniref:translation initiation factor IF-2-like n=1 Tax=Sturnira hondurensis TaxID=192404 RepID=UPI0018792433|nr:translation initiation factor IF-2-like [Sturnira hondurensis]